MMKVPAGVIDPVGYSIFCERQQITICFSNTAGRSCQALKTVESIQTQTDPDSNVGPMVMTNEGGDLIALVDIDSTLQQPVFLRF